MSRGKGSEEPRYLRDRRQAISPKAVVSEGGTEEEEIPCRGRLRTNASASFVGT